MYYADIYDKDNKFIKRIDVDVAEKSNTLFVKTKKGFIVYSYC